MKQKTSEISQHPNVTTPLSIRRGAGGEAAPLSHGRGAGGEASAGAGAYNPNTTRLVVPLFLSLREIERMTDIARRVANTPGVTWCFAKADNTVPSAQRLRFSPRALVQELQDCERQRRRQPLLIMPVKAFLTEAEVEFLCAAILNTYLDSKDGLIYDGILHVLIKALREDFYPIKEQKYYD